MNLEAKCCGALIQISIKHRSHVRPHGLFKLTSTLRSVEVHKLYITTTFILPSYATALVFMHLLKYTFFIRLNNYNFKAHWSHNCISSTSVCERAQEPAIVPMYVVSKQLFQKFTWKKGEMRGAMENNLIAYQSYFKLQDWRANHFPWGKYVLGD